MALLIKNIKELIGIDPDNRPWVRGAEMKQLNTLLNAYLIIQDGLIAGYGSMEQLNHNEVDGKYLLQIDATGKMVFPSFCDPHTHLVYAGSRELEYVDKIKGLSYEEIAKQGGGILLHYFIPLLKMNSMMLPGSDWRKSNIWGQGLLRLRVVMV